MTTLYTNIPQTISQFIPQLNKNQVVSVQTIDKDKNIIYRSFKIYTFPNPQAKDIKLIDIGSFSPIYNSSSYYEITQEFIIDTYSSTQEIINNVLQPSFYTWESTTTYLNSKRQLANREKLKVTWTPPITQEQLQQQGEIAVDIEQYLQPFTIQIGDVYGVDIPANCLILDPPNLNTNLLLDVNTVTIKPLALAPLVFSFRGVDVISIELPIKTITDNPKLLYPKTLQNPPKVPPNIIGLNTNFLDLNDIPLNNYNARRNRQTTIL